MLFHNGFWSMNENVLEVWRDQYMPHKKKTLLSSHCSSTLQKGHRLTDAKLSQSLVLPRREKVVIEDYFSLLSDILYLLPFTLPKFPTLRTQR